MQITTQANHLLYKVRYWCFEFDGNDLFSLAEQFIILTDKVNE